MSTSQPYTKRPMEKTLEMLGKLTRDKLEKYPEMIPVFINQLREDFQRIIPSSPDPLKQADNLLNAIFEINMKPDLNLCENLLFIYDRMSAEDQSSEPGYLVNELYSALNTLGIENGIQRIYKQHIKNIDDVLKRKLTKKLLEECANLGKFINACERYGIPIPIDPIEEKDIDTSLEWLDQLTHTYNSSEKKDENDINALRGINHIISTYKQSRDIEKNALNGIIQHCSSYRQSLVNLLQNLTDKTTDPSETKQIQERIAMLDKMTDAATGKTKTNPSRVENLLECETLLNSQDFQKGIVPTKGTTGLFGSLFVFVNILAVNIGIVAPDESEAVIEEFKKDIRKGLRR